MYRGRIWTWLQRSIWSNSKAHFIHQFIGNWFYFYFIFSVFFFSHCNSKPSSATWTEQLTTGDKTSIFCILQRCWNYKLCTSKFMIFDYSIFPCVSLLCLPSHALGVPVIIFLCNHIFFSLDFSVSLMLFGRTIWLDVYYSVCWHGICRHRSSSTLQMIRLELFRQFYIFIALWIVWCAAMCINLNIFLFRM